MCNSNECNGRVFDESKVVKPNALLKFKPELFYEWDFEKNDKLGYDVYKVTFGSKKKAWWKCENGHVWETEPSSRYQGFGCSYCSGRYAWKGETDMWTTNPKLASMLLNPEDGYKYKQSSNQRVDWKCPNCKQIVKSKFIDHVKIDGLPCSNCSDGLSLSEKILYNLFKQLKIKFAFDKTKVWSNNKRYDFYLPDHDTIIEVNGIQHYEQSARGRSLKEEQENDNYKRELALENGIKNYVEIDCRKSDFDYIKDNIMLSELNRLLDLSSVNWKEVFEKVPLSIMHPICELWNKGHSTTEICSIENLDKMTVLKYLKMGAKIDICDFTVEKSRFRRKPMPKRTRRKKLSS